MINVKIKDKSGVKLLTKDKFCNDDINVTLDDSLLGTPEVEYPNEAVKYYKENRNKNYPYFPLPSEMEETQDTIYMLYGASGCFCCPVFNITFTECVVTIQKYMNTELVTEYTLNDVVSGTTYYMQFSEEDSDYSTYNYIVIKMQGTITKHYLDYKQKFNGIEANQSVGNGLIEVSGNCKDCDVKVMNNQQGYSISRFYQLKYYSFSGINRIDINYMFSYCVSLIVIPELVFINKLTSVKGMCANCSSLIFSPNIDTSDVTTMESFLYNCSSLIKLNNYDMTNVTSTRNMCSGCKSLKESPEFYTPNLTDVYDMFSNNYSLEKIGLFETSKVTDWNGIIYYCHNLKEFPNFNMDSARRIGLGSSANSLQIIPEIDVSSASTIGDLLSGAYSLVKFGMYGMKVSFTLIYSILLSQNELVKILNNLATVTTTQTLTLGSTLLAKLTDEEKAIAINKGWTLA